MVGGVASAAGVGTLTATARGRVGAPEGATVEQRLDMLEQRTDTLHEEVGALQATVEDSEQRLTRRIADAVSDLSADADQLRSELRDFQLDSVRSSASALPVVVVGIILGGVAPDAPEFPVWAWLLFVLGLCTYAVRRSWRIWRDSRN